MFNFEASDVSEIENLDELEVYGDSDKAAGTTLTSYVFEVRAQACLSHTSMHTPAITHLLIRSAFYVFVYIFRISIRQVLAYTCNHHSFIRLSLYMFMYLEYLLHGC